MSDYDYLNARVRGMSTGLFTADFYEQVLAAQGSDLLVDSLLTSPYGSALRDALSAQRGVQTVEEGLRRGLFAALSQVRELAPEAPRRLLDIQLRRWDLDNIITIIRGKASGAGVEDIVDAMFPAGLLDEARLQIIAAEPDPAAVADALVVMDFPGAYELRRAVRRAVGPPDYVSIEVLLSTKFFERALATTGGRDENDRLFADQLRRQIDLANIGAILQVVRYREAGTAAQTPEPIENGTLATGVVNGLAACENLDDAFELLATTYFEPGIERGILSYGERRRLGVMERYLQRVVIAAGCKMFRADPLGIGVAAGFIWKKYNEFLNLRIILRGKAYGRSAAGIREEMLIV